MARQYMGAHEAEIPVAEIMQVYAAWSDEIVNAVADELLIETKVQAMRAFDDKTGLLRKRIQKRKSRFDPDGVIVIADAPHAHLVEFGHVMLDKNKQPTVRDHVPKHPFLGEAEKIIRSKLKEIIEYEVKR